LFSKHLFPSLQGSQIDPPQSMSVSSPSFLLLSHAGGLQVPFKQFPDSQSTSWSHVDSNGHFPHPDACPQSIPTSSPFRIPSVQLVTVHVPNKQ